MRRRHSPPGVGSPPHPLPALGVLGQHLPCPCPCFLLLELPPRLHPLSPSPRGEESKLKGGDTLPQPCPRRGERLSWTQSPSSARYFSAFSCFYYFCSFPNNGTCIKVEWRCLITGCKPHPKAKTPPMNAPREWAVV